MKKFTISFSLLLFLSIHSLPLQAKSYEPSFANEEKSVATQIVPIVPKVQKTPTPPPPLASIQKIKTQPIPPTTKPKIKTAPTPAPKPQIKTNPVPVPNPPAAPILDCSTGTLNMQFLCLLNDYRKSKGLNALSYDPSLDMTATVYSTWMDATKTMSHTGENGSKFYERCAQQGTTCDAENLAMGYTTAEKLFTAWKNSPGHNTNMLGNHTKTGLSLVGIYTTSLFK